MSRQEARELTERLRLARGTASTKPEVKQQLEALARDAGHLWNYHNRIYCGATRPLWDIIADAISLAYVIGYTDAEYDAGRVLKSLDGPLPNEQEQEQQQEVARPSTLNPQPEELTEAVASRLVSRRRKKPKNGLSGQNIRAE